MCLWIYNHTNTRYLIFLGGLTGDGDTFQKVARKIIGQGMKTIIFEETKFERDDPKTSETVGSIETVNGECLAIYRHVDCRNATDVWLSQLIDEIRKSVKNIMRRALKESVDMNEYSFDDYTKTVRVCKCINATKKKKHTHTHNLYLYFLIFLTFICTI